MQTALDHFETNIKRVYELGGLYHAINGLTTAAIDPSDILRAQHVLAVSALDQFVHELVRLGMLEIFDGLRPTTSAYLRFRMPMDAISGGISGASLRANFEAEIRSQHSYLSFQQPDRIADAVRHISSVELWNAVAVILEMTAKDVKDRVRLIVDRRNKIAHEADVDPSYPGARWPVIASDVQSAADFIRQICTGIHAVI